jgi:hypothetical protein
MFMFQRIVVALIACGLAAGGAAAEDPPAPDVLVDRMIEAVGGDAFSKLGVLKLEIAEEDIKREGGTQTNTYVAYVDTEDVDNLRMDLPGDIVVARVGADGWSSVAGEIDERPQTPSMAYRALNQNLFKLLLPYSLRMQRVWTKEVVEVPWEDGTAWALLVPFTKGFFVSPVLETIWRIVVDKETFKILAYDFMPPAEYRHVEKTGVRYGILAYNEIEGAQIPSRVLAIGLTLDGEEIGTYRVTKIDSSVYDAWAPTLFIDPRRLEAIEEGQSPMPGIQ